MSEKTERPSPKRLRDARAKGEVARSRTLASALGALCAFAALAAWAPAAAALLRAFAREALREAASGEGSAALAAGRAARALALACAPVLAAAFLGGAAGAGLQVGALLNVGALAPRAERLSPGAGLKRVFAARSLFEVVKAALIAAAVLWLAWAALRDGARRIALLPRLPAEGALAAAFELSRGLLLKALCAAAALGALDYLYQRWAHREGLRMSRDDLRREHKESEGDPHQRARRKALHRALMGGTAARGVQKATAVVVNPTHVAVALRYDPSEAAAPTIVARGRGAEAARIRHLARQLRVPIVQDVPLARALARFEVGEEVPEELYEAAAVVLRQVLGGSAAAPAALRGERP